MESVKITTSNLVLIAHKAAVSSALLIVCVSPGNSPASGHLYKSRTAAHVQCLHLGQEEKKALPSVAYVPYVPSLGLRFL